MLKPNLSDKQIEIIREICNMQIQSLIRVSMEINASSEEDKLGHLMRIFNKLKGSPPILLTLDSDSMSLFKHNLMHYESDDTREQENEPICKLWRQLFIAENIGQYITA